MEELELAEEQATCHHSCGRSAAQHSHAAARIADIVGSLACSWSDKSQSLHPGRHIFQALRQLA